MVSMLVSNGVGWVKPKTCKISTCSFSTKYTVLMSKSKNWLAWNQDNVSEWSNMRTFVRVS